MPALAILSLLLSLLCVTSCASACTFFKCCPCINQNQDSPKSNTVISNKTKPLLLSSSSSFLLKDFNLNTKNDHEENITGSVQLDTQLVHYKQNGKNDDDAKNESIVTQSINSQSFVNRKGSIYSLRGTLVTYQSDKQIDPFSKLNSLLSDNVTNNLGIDLNNFLTNNQVDLFQNLNASPGACNNSDFEEIIHSYSASGTSPMANSPLMEADAVKRIIQDVIKQNLLNRMKSDCSRMIESFPVKSLLTNMDTTRLYLGMLDLYFINKRDIQEFLIAKCMQRFYELNTNSIDHEVNYTSNSSLNTNLMILNVQHIISHQNNSIKDTGALGKSLIVYRKNLMQFIFDNYDDFDIGIYDIAADYNTMNAYFFQYIVVSIEMYYNWIYLFLSQECSDISQHQRMSFQFEFVSSIDSNSKKKISLKEMLMHSHIKRNYENIMIVDGLKASKWNKTMPNGRVVKIKSDKFKISHIADRDETQVLKSYFDQTQKDEYLIFLRMFIRMRLL